MASGIATGIVKGKHNLEQELIFLNEEIERLKKKQKEIEAEYASKVEVMKKEIVCFQNDIDKLSESILSLGSKKQGLTKEVAEIERIKKEKEELVSILANQEKDLYEKIESEKDSLTILKDEAELAFENVKKDQSVLVKEKEEFRVEKEALKAEKEQLQTILSSIKDREIKLEEAKASLGKREILLTSSQNYAKEELDSIKIREANVERKEDYLDKEKDEVLKSKNELAVKEVALAQKEKEIQTLSKPFIERANELKMREEDLIKREKEYLVLKEELGIRERIVKIREKAVSLS